MYISTVVFRPGSQGDKVTPARAVGLTGYRWRVKPASLKSRSMHQPKSSQKSAWSQKIKVDNLGGKKAMVTVSAVDVGILNITNKHQIRLISSSANIASAQNSAICMRRRSSVLMVWSAKSNAVVTRVTRYQEHAEESEVGRFILPVQLQRKR